MANGKPAATAAELTNTEVLARQPRLKPLYTPADVEAVPYFDDEDKERAPAGDFDGGRAK